MQDKEFDEVFRSGLEGLEAEPSERVWTGIDDELNLARKRKIWLPILRIAAVLVVMISVGVVFLLKQDKVNTASGDQPKQAIAKVQPVTQPSKSAGQAAKIIPAIQPVAVKNDEPKRMENTIARVDAGKKEQHETGKVEPQVNQNPVPDAAKHDEPVAIAAVSVPIEIKQPVVPDNSVPLTNKLLGVNNNITKPMPALIAQTMPLDSTKKPKHKGIHSFGDLVNMVANRVDKRHGARKADDDDDDSAIAKVNRGIQKLSAEQEK